MGLTFLAVHAHPDDESSSTGGLFRLLADQGVRTVLVTCTDGEMGDGPGGAKPDAAGHDASEVAAVRARELDDAAAILGIARVERLGYLDSGMLGWPQNNDPDCFWATPVDEAATRLAAVMAEERPEVVVTYNERGFYGHPDHIQAHRVTLKALDLLDYEPTLYYNAVPESVWTRWRERWEEEARRRAEADDAAGVETPVEGADDEIDFAIGTPDDEIAVAVDVRSVTDAKYDALAAHHSQIAESSWMEMSREEFREAMGTEWFVRARNPLGLARPVEDIFAGYRD